MTHEQQLARIEQCMRIQADAEDRMRAIKRRQDQTDMLCAKIRAAMEHQARMTWLLLGAPGVCN